jgi:hypothetical protein
MKKNILRRIVSALSVLPIMMALSITTFAATDNMETMGEEIYEWYRLIRYCSVLFMMISFAIAGFRIVSRAFVQSMKYNTDDIIMQVIISIIAFAVMMFLPRIIGSVRDLLNGSAWQPGDFPASEGNDAWRPVDSWDDIKDLFDKIFNKEG